MNPVTIHIVVFSIYMTAAYGQDGLCPDASWQVVGEDSTCLKFVDNYRLTAGQAEAWCANHGSALIRFANYAERSQFSEAATVRSKDGWWSALNDVGHPGTWTWGGDEQITPGALAWATEPTDTHHAENCVSMDSGGFLSDDDCTQRMGIICSYTPAITGNCEGDFTAAGGQCYYPSPLDDPGEVVTWAAANNACLAQSPLDGVKPVLANFTTAALLSGLQQIVQGAATQGKRWVGLTDQATESMWHWADDSLVQDTSFFTGNWKHYPDRGAGRHSCGLVHSNAEMEEAACTDTHHFVCKINVSPDSYDLWNGLGCPAPWLRGGDKCYFFNPHTSLSLDDTRHFCSGVQGSLLQLQTLNERDWVTQTAISLHMYDMWTGLKRASTGSSTWLWDDGTSADSDFCQWNKQPNHPLFTTADCAFINRRGRYNDDNCFTPHNFICEMDTEGVPCPKNWLSDDSKDMTTCYYISSNATDGKASWQEAVDKCVQMAGVPDAHLVAITSQDEMDYMMSEMTSQPYSGFWTDLTDKEVRGVWAFSRDYEGTPPAIPWDQEPNNRGGHEDCAVLFTNGKLNDVACARLAHVLCERPAAGRLAPPSVRTSTITNNNNPNNNNPGATTPLPSVSGSGAPATPQSLQSTTSAASVHFPLSLLPVLAVTLLYHVTDFCL